MAAKPTLEQVRVRKLWSPNRLSKESGVAVTTILGVERGEVRRVRLGTIEKLSKALGVEPDAIAWPGNPFGDDEDDSD